MPGKLYFKRLFQVWLRTPKKVVGLAPCSKPYWLKHASLPKPGHFQENFKEAALNFLIIIKFNFTTCFSNIDVTSLCLGNISSFAIVISKFWSMVHSTFFDFTLCHKNPRYWAQQQQQQNHCFLQVSSLLGNEFVEITLKKTTSVKFFRVILKDDDSALFFFPAHHYQLIQIKYKKKMIGVSHWKMCKLFSPPAYPSMYHRPASLLQTFSIHSKLTFKDICFAHNVSESIGMLCRHIIIFGM